MINAKKIEMGGNAPCNACRVDADKVKDQFIHVVEISIDRNRSRFPSETYLCLSCARRLQTKLAKVLASFAAKKKPKPPPPDYENGSYRCGHCGIAFYPKPPALQIICPKCKVGSCVHVNFEKQG